MQEKIILTLCREGDGITSAGADWTTHIFEYSTAFYLYLPKKKKKNKRQILPTSKMLAPCR